MSIAYPTGSDRPRSPSARRCECQGPSPKKLLTAYLVATLTMCGAVRAEESIVGVWTAKSIETKDIASGTVVKPFGEQPNATFIFTAGGNMAPS